MNYIYIDTQYICINCITKYVANGYLNNFTIMDHYLMPSKLVDAVRTQLNYMVDTILKNKQYFKSAFPSHLNYALQ